MGGAEAAVLAHAADIAGGAALGVVDFAVEQTNHSGHALGGHGQAGGGDGKSNEARGIECIHDRALGRERAVAIAGTQTYASDVNALLTGARKLVPDLDTRRVVRAFAGGRPVIQGTNDFFIGQSAVVPGLFQAAGIQSPGVASAPAIAERMELVMREAGVELHERADWNPIRRAPDDFDRAPLARKEELIESDPAWGQIVCRCETVPEAEIVAAIRRQPGAVSVEGVKRRCRAGMGRCQSGFCQSRVVAILARELGCDPSKVLLEDAGSWLVEGPLKGVR